MTKKLFLDIETYCPLDLKKSGAYAYAEHHDHQVLMCTYSVDYGPVQLAVGHDQIKAELGEKLTNPEWTKVAHNAQFDRVNLSWLAGCSAGQYLDPDQWEDTMALAAENGLPQSLDKLSKALGVEQKDSAGTRLINYFSKPDRNGKQRTSSDDPEKWQEFIDYAIQDTATLVQVYRALPPWPSEFERKLWAVDQRINDRGISVDHPLVEWALEQDGHNRLESEAELRQLLGVENPNSVQQFKAALEATGLDLPNLRVDTVKQLLQEPQLTQLQRRALQLRAEIALAASKKYQAILHGVNFDHRLRGQFRFFGAHTGRWSGRGVQLQNLPRAELKHPELVILDSQLGLGADAASLKALVRQVFTGPFVVSDYSAIEARVLAWVAGESWALEAFSKGRDIYVETAERMGGLSRQQGKVAVLALGYQGGVNSLRHMGAQGDDDELQMLKVQWRRANRRIVKLWEELDRAFAEGGNAGRLKVRVQGKNRVLVLPSGRYLTYRNVKHERWAFTDEEGNTQFKRGWRFDGGLGRTDTYGGRLSENAVQAIARDLLADLLYRLELQGLHVVGHVHDEVLVQVDPERGSHQDQLQHVVEAMESAPDWAEGLPLGAEGFITERYRKG